MRFMKFFILLPVSAATILMAVSCGSSHKEGVALSGSLKADSISDFVLSYNEEGDIARYKTIDIVTDEKGNFEIPDSVVPAEGTHAHIMADERGYFGVWLEPGKTAVIDITGNPDEKLVAAFSGENADINDIYNDIETSFDIMIYTPQDPSERMKKDEALARLDNERKRIADKVATLKDADKREYYGEYASMLADRMEGFVIEDDAYDNGTDPLADPAYQALIKRVDPNKDAALHSGMVFIWLNTACPNDSSASVVQNHAKQLETVDTEITNKLTRKALYNAIARSFFSYNKPTPEEASEFMKIYAEKAKEYPEFIDAYTLQSQAVRVVKSGDTVAYDPTIASPDGKTCKLSDLYGKVLYIDFWATWCGPCCKQIPHLEKLVAKMKGVKGLEFISISCDSDTEAWKKKLAKDNPDWPQYIFADGESDKFMTVMNITGIPRFMIIGPDGNIINPEAPMPSDPKLEQILMDCLN